MSFLTDPQFQAVALQGLLFASLVLPLLEKLAEHTSNKVDDGIVKVLSDGTKYALQFLPRLRTGK